MGQHVSATRRTLQVLAGTFAVYRLPAQANIPAWAEGPWLSITRTPEELSLVCRLVEGATADQVAAPWRCVRIAGVLDFALVGVIAELTRVLAAAEIPVFVVSTFDTDYFLTPTDRWEQAKAALQGAGYAVKELAE